MSGRGYIAATEDERCEMCGKLDECRPYGPGGMKVCFECGMKDEAEANRRMNNLIFGAGNA